MLAECLILNITSPMLAECLILNITSPMLAECLILNITSPMLAEWLILNITSPMLAEWLILNITSPMLAECLILNITSSMLAECLILNITSPMLAECLILNITSPMQAGDLMEMSTRLHSHPAITSRDQEVILIKNKLKIDFFPGVKTLLLSSFFVLLMVTWLELVKYEYRFISPCTNTIYQLSNRSNSIYRNLLSLNLILLFEYYYLIITSESCSPVISK